MNSISYHEKVARKLKIGREFLYLTQKDCINTGITADEVLKFVEAALAAHGRKEVEMPAIIGIHPLQNSLFHAMPAWMPAQSACGIKWISSFPDNEKRFNLPRTTGLLILNDSESGFPLAVMDAVWITAKRTPAVTAISAKLLGNPDAETFGMFGCGMQGRGHIRFLPTVMPDLKKIYVFDILEEAMDSLIAELQPEMKAKILKARSYEDLVKSCETVASATAILAKPDPQVRDSWISEGQTILICDLDSFWELDIMNRADKFIFDSQEEHINLKNSGYYPNGLPKKIYAELGEIVAGLKPGREDKDELIVVNNIGMAIEDVALGKAVFGNALEKGMGKRLPL
ncbi:MAG: ornithine cyclodeaminase family protein [Candidatus Aerophobetes bacterium]|nr:ornithine cyclodeaminase family protein [Candidatus Aerophobetes bacterium]